MWRQWLTHPAIKITEAETMSIIICDESIKGNCDIVKDLKDKIIRLGDGLVNLTMNMDMGDLDDQEEFDACEAIVEEVRKMK